MRCANSSAGLKNQRFSWRRKDKEYWDPNFEGNIKIINAESVVGYMYYKIPFERMLCPFCNAEEFLKRTSNASDDTRKDLPKLNFNKNMNCFDLKIDMRKLYKETECKSLAKVFYNGETQGEYQTTVEDHLEYPHECPQCKGKAYVGLLTCECPKCGKFNLNY